jgi:RNA polymerase sigma factor (sigma-70 family)
MRLVPVGTPLYHGGRSGFRRLLRSTGAVGAGLGRPSSPASEDDDLSVVRRVAAKDRQAFEILYHRYARRLYGYLSKFIRRPEIAEEVLNDVMLAIWQSAPRFNYTSRLSTWIFGIAHYKALKALKRAGVAALPLTAAVAPDGVEADEPEGVVQRAELASTLASALDRLPPEQRAVVELAFGHERSYQEIAEITGSPVNTVKTRMFHARKRLARLLTGSGLGHPLAAQGESV